MKSVLIKTLLTILIIFCAVNLIIEANGDESMPKVKKAIKEYIEGTDSKDFMERDFSSATKDLTKDILHFSARNDMIGSNNCGEFVISKEFGDAILEFQKLVVDDLTPTFKALSKTRFVS